MLHRAPLRRPHHAELLAACLLALAPALLLSVFYWFTAPNWDVVLLHLFAVVLLALPLPPLAVACFGTRSLQVEHAGVVMGTFWGKRPLRLLVWKAEQVRAFDWEYDGRQTYALRLLIQRRPGEKPAMMTVMHTESPYLAAAVWRDLELHYPGSGLRSEAPGAEAPTARGSRLAGLSALLCGAVLAGAVFAPVLQPLRIAAFGRTTPAVITALQWDSSEKGSTYHLEVCSAGADAPRRSASAFPQTAPLPQVGQTLAALWSDDTAVFYTTDEVLPFLMPLPWSAACLLLMGLGLAQLYPRRRGRKSPKPCRLRA
ncbi:MAG: hypothetical protein MJ051_07895 [Akkermansia sp.]|nr:hypothetical protein [Akkermansia sp.]